MEPLRFVTHKSARILVVDASGSADLEESIALLHEAKKTIGSQPPKSLLLLTDVTGSRFNVRAVDEVKRYASFNTPYVKASAVVGITGFTRVVLEAVRTLTGRAIHAFDTQGEALDWLADR